MITTTILSMIAAAAINPAPISPLAEARPTDTPDAKMAKVARVTNFPAPDNNPIMTLPAGAKVENYVEAGEGWVNTMSGPQSQDAGGAVAEIATLGDEVYIRSLLSIASSNAWLKGIREGEKVTFTFPQCIDMYSRDEDGIITDYYEYAFMSDKIGDLISYSFYPADDQIMSFTIGEDGVWRNDKPDVFIGKYYWYSNSYSWAGGGEYIETFSPITFSTTEVPAGVEFEDWTLIANDGAMTVGVGMADGKCWLKDIAIGISDMTGAMIEGTVETDGTISFDANQYLGISKGLGHTIWFRAGTMEQVNDPDYGLIWDFFPNAPLVFTYDAEKKSMKSDGAFALCYTTGEFRALNIYAYPELHYDAPGTPITNLRTPIFLAVFEPEPNYPVYEIQFLTPNYTQDDVIIPMEDYFFEVWIDGKLFTFTKEEYQLTKNTTQIQCGFYNGWGFYSESTVQKIMFTHEYILDLSVRTLYRAADGSEVFSPFLHMIGDGSGVNEVSDAETIETVYYDLQGRKLPAAASGPVIRLERLSDGSVRSSRIILR